MKQNIPDIFRWIKTVKYILKLKAVFLKLINNWSSLNKVIHYRDRVWVSDPSEKIYQTLNTVFNHISKPFHVPQKYFATRRIFQLSSQCFVVKHSLSSLMYYIASEEIQRIAWKGPSFQ